MDEARTKLLVDLKVKAEFLLAERDRLGRQREEYSKSLRAYAEAAWHVIEPATAFVPGWHIDAICEHLEAVTTGDIRRLVINMPPRSMKSLLVSVIWMTWVWTFRPEAKWLFASYDEALSRRDHRKCRRVFESSWFQDRWGDQFQLTIDRADWMENTFGAHRIATTIDGFGTGEGADFRVVDDPHNVMQALSDRQRQRALIWWDETMTTRFTDPKSGGRVIVMQRLHEGDLSGHVLQKGGYEHLMLPMEFERERHCVTSIGWKDPRTKEGELLWPARFTAEVVTELKEGLGPYGAAGQLQQRPAPRGGGFFEEAWFRWYDAVPQHVHKYGASDYAVTDEGGDYTVHGVIGVDPDDNIYILDWWRKQTSSDIWIEAVMALMVKHKPMAWAEEKGQIEKSIGPFLRKRMREKRVYCVRRPFPSVGDKSMRARSIQARMAGGRVYFPMKAPWKDDLIAELLTFPAGVHDDQVDVLALFGRMVDRLLPGKPPKPDPPDPFEVRQPTLDELIKLQPRHDGEKYERI